MLIQFMHHIDCSFQYFFYSNCVWCNLPLGLSFFFFLFLFLFLLLLLSILSILSNLSIMVRKTRAHRTSTSSSTPSFDSEKFLSEKNQETYEKLNLLRSVWAKRKVVLDELDPEIRWNFERKGWLPLMDIDHPPSATLIREYSDLFVHSNDSNTQFVRSWIRGEEYVITPSIVAFALEVPKVQ